MRTSEWKRISHVSWKNEARREYLPQAEYRARADELYKRGHLAETFDLRKEWMQEGIFIEERRGYWDHLYIGGPEGVRHIISNNFDDTQNAQARQLGYVPNVGRTANAIEQRIFKEQEGVTERQAFGYSEPSLNKCVPKQLYHINSRYVNKKINSAGKADFSSHYPANICGRLPDWSHHKVIEGTAPPTAEYPFVFYTRSGHIAEHKTFDTHYWRDEDLSGDLFGTHYSKVDPDKDISILCPASKYTLDKTIEILYNMKCRGESIDGIPAKSVLVSSIGYKHLSGAHNTKNRLYHLAAVCIARANQKMIDFYNEHRRQILQIIVDGVIYLGAHEVGEHRKALGVLHQEITDKSFIMRGINQYLFLDRATGECAGICHSGLDFNLKTDKLEDIRVWQKSRKE